MAPSDGSYKSTGVGFHRLRHFGCPPMVRRHQDAGRRSRELCHMPDARSLARFPPRLSLSLSPFVGGRRRCTRRARRLRGAVGVVCRRRGGRAWVGAWSSNRSAAQATPTHPNDAKASPSPSAGRRDAKTMEGRTFFPAEVETMKVCKKWLLYSNGENSPGKTVNCWLML